MATKANHATRKPALTEKVMRGLYMMADAVNANDLCAPGGDLGDRQVKDDVFRAMDWINAMDKWRAKQ